MTENDKSKEETREKKKKILAKVLERKDEGEGGRYVSGGGGDCLGLRVRNRETYTQRETASQSARQRHTDILKEGGGGGG